MELRKNEFCQIQPSTTLFFAFPPPENFFQRVGREWTNYCQLSTLNSILSKSISLTFGLFSQIRSHFVFFLLVMISDHQTLCISNLNNFLLLLLIRLIPYVTSIFLSH